MKTIANALLVLAVSVVAGISQAAGVAQGNLTFSLKTAGEPVVAVKTGDALLYQAFDRALQGSLAQGPKSLQWIRNFEIGFAGTTISKVIDAAVNAATDPKNTKEKYNHIFEFFDANPWMLPIVQYAEGNDSDDEQIYVTANRELRGSAPLSENVTKWVTGMREAMWHVPRFEGISFRGTRLMSERIEKYYPVGNEASDAAFISTSLEPTTAFSFAVPGVDGATGDDHKVAVIFVVYGKTGRPVSAFTSMHAHEQEILFANGTRFTTTGRTPIFTDSVLGQSMVIVLQEN